MSKFLVLFAVALCALVAAVSAVPYPLPVGASAGPARETLKGAEQVYYAGYGYGVPYASYAAYPYTYYG